jgi:predicted nucleotidyltransferase
VVEGKGTGIDESFGLKPRDLELIREVLRRHTEVREARIFGSRAAGHFEGCSDIDLALWGDLNPTLIGRIRQELDELPLPYTFDVIAYDRIQCASLKRHIDEVGKTVHGAGAGPLAAAENRISR